MKTYFLNLVLLLFFIFTIISLTNGTILNNNKVILLNEINYDNKDILFNERKKAREFIIKKKLEDIELQKEELKNKQKLIMTERTENDDYIERLKYCYKIISNMLKSIGNKKYIIDGFDPNGNLIKGESNNLIKIDFDFTEPNNIIYYYTHSLASSETYSKNPILRIKMQEGIYNYDNTKGFHFCINKDFALWNCEYGNLIVSGFEYKPISLLSFFTAIKNFTRENDGKYSWDGKTLSRMKNNIIPTVYNWLIKNKILVDKELTNDKRGYRLKYEFNDIKFNSLEDNFIRDIGNGNSMDPNGFSGINPSRKIYLQYLLDEHETLQPAKEFRERPEFKYILCNYLMEILENITEKYYFFGKISYNKLEFIEKTIIEIR